MTKRNGRYKIEQAVCNMRKNMKRYQMENTKEATKNPVAGTMVSAPYQVLEANIKTEVERTKMPVSRLILLGLLAGMFIAGGAAASSLAMHSVANVGLSRLVGGAIFPVGLMIIIFSGCELFTGDCLLFLGFLDKKVSLMQMLKVLVVVFASNLFGSVIWAFMVSESGQFDYSGGLLGAYTIKVALGKTTMSFGTAFFSGILCNIFVCMAVLLAAAAKDAAGKILGIFFPIMAFVVSGYEHCVANMYYIPAGLMAKGNSAYVQKAIEAYGYTKEQLEQLNAANFFTGNLLPVTLGNMAGGMLFVGAFLYFANRHRL